MSDSPKFTVVDRRKFRGEDEDVPSAEPAAPKATPEAEVAGGSVKAAETSASVPGPRLTLVEPSGQAAKEPEAAVAVAEMPVGRLEVVSPQAEPHQVEPGLDQEEPGHDELDQEERVGEELRDADLPPAPSAEEIRFQKAAYDKAAERLEDLVRAQNPGAPAAEKIGFEHLVQQLYLSAMMQMGAGTPEGQRPRIDILGARQTMDLLSVVLDKTAGNLSAEEDRTLETVLFELRMTFLELTRMIASPQAPPMPPPPGMKR